MIKYLKSFVIKVLSKMDRTRSKGSWIFKHQRTGWMHDSEIRCQLPWIYQWFCWFCIFQKKIDIGSRIWFGEKIFSLVSGFRLRFSIADTAKVKIANYIVHVDLNDPRFIQVINELKYPSVTIDVIRKFLQPGDTFVDVGANHGSFSIVASQKVGPDGLIVAVEPQPKLASLIKLSLQSSSQGNFQVHQIACGDKAGTIKFYIPESSSGAAGMFATYSASSTHKIIEVDQKKFDDLAWVNFPGHLVLKLDVEGSEYAFLQGARQMIMARHPIILMEINQSSLMASGIDPTVMISLLKEYKYGKFCFESDSEKKYSIDDLSFVKDTNVVFLPDELTF